MKGLGFSTADYPVEESQDVYYTADFGDTGHGFRGGTTLLGIAGDTRTIERTNLVPLKGQSTTMGQ